MFPFFKKKAIAVPVETYEESRFAAGLETTTAKKTKAITAADFFFMKF